MYGDEEHGRDRRYREEIPEEKLRTWYRRYYQRGMSLEEIGRRLGINPRYLSQRFKELGLPVSRRLHERIMTD